MEEIVSKEFTLEEVQILIAKECDNIKFLLLEKNKSYGNSVISPKRIFSKASPIEQIKVRIDDKLSRLENLKSSNSDLTEDPAYRRNQEDTEQDMIGYLILLRVAKQLYGD